MIQNLTNKLLTGVLFILFATMAFAQNPSGPCQNPSTGPAPTPYVNGILWVCPAAQGGTGLWKQFWPVADDGLYGNINAGATARKIAHARYDFAVDGGATGTIIPTFNTTLPIRAVITNAWINSTTAVTAAGSATVAVGLSAGSTGTSLLAATAKASYSLNAFVQGVPVNTAATAIKLTAPGQISVLVATGPLLTGVIEIYVEYYVSST